MDLFVRLHGMIFTKISLDSFPFVMSRFMERLEEDARLDGISRKATITQVDWIIMATVNIAAVLQYGATHGLLRKALAQEGAERRRAQAQAADEEDEEGVVGGEEGDGADGESHAPKVTVSSADKDLPSSTSAEAFPPTLTHSLQLTFAVLDFTLKQPHRQQGLHQVLNPYITIFLTFLATLSRQAHVSSIICPYIPWKTLVEFLNLDSPEIREESRLIGGPPLPEDWAGRGMEWVGRRVYERGFWKAKAPGRGSGSMAVPRVGERFGSEMDVLLASFDGGIDISEGVVDEVEGTDLTDGPVAVNFRRWKRVQWAAGVMAKHVDGLRLVDGKVDIVEPLEGTIRAIQAEEEIRRREEEERTKRSSRRGQAEDVGTDVFDGYAAGESDDEDDDPELAVLRVSVIVLPTHGETRRFA